MNSKILQVQIMEALVLVGHGSRLPHSKNVVMEVAEKIKARGIYRITSYNVCYTKLLRTFYNSKLFDNSLFKRVHGQNYERNAENH